MKAAVLDSTAVIAFLDPTDELHGQACTDVFHALNMGHRLVLPATALAELYQAAYRLDPEGGPASVDGFVAELISEVHPINKDAARTAGRRAEHTGLPITAALTLSVLDQAEAEYVLTADSDWTGLDQVVVVGVHLP